MPIRIKGPTADRHPRRKWDSPERRKERQKEYMDKHGPQQPRRKRLATTDPHKKIRDQRKFSEAGFKDLRVAKATGSSVGKTKGPKGTGYKPKWPPKGWQDRGMGKKFPRPKENLIEKLGGSEKAKPHSTKEGRVASGERRIRRILKRRPKTMEQRPLPKYTPKPSPGRANFRIGGKAGTGPSPGTRIKARKSREREWWTTRGGPEGTKGDTHGQKFFGPIDKELRKKRPHSSPEGRAIDVKRLFDKPKKNILAGGVARPSRVKKGIGGVIKKVISKVTKPKGVFKPKPKPGKVDQKFLDFIRTGKAVDKHGVKVNVAKAAERLTGKPHVDHGIRKKIKHLGKGKAEGGRIGLKKGSVHKPGSHSWYLQHMNKNKKASGGRIGLKHGGSVGAAVRGHGAEIK